MTIIISDFTLPHWKVCFYEEYVYFIFKFQIWKFLTLIECILSISTHHNLQSLPHAVHFIIRPTFDLFFLLLLVTH